MLIFLQWLNISGTNINLSRISSRLFLYFRALRNPKQQRGSIYIVNWEWLPTTHLWTTCQATTAPHLPTWCRHHWRATLIRPAMCIHLLIKTHIPIPCMPVSWSVISTCSERHSAVWSEILDWQTLSNELKKVLDCSESSSIIIFTVLYDLSQSYFTRQGIVLSCTKSAMPLLWHVRFRHPSLRVKGWVKVFIYCCPLVFGQVVGKSA